MDTAVQTYNPGILAFANLTRTSLDISVNLNFGDWGLMMRQLALMEGAVHWWIGDALVYAGKRYGETYVEAEALTGFAMNTLKQDKWVADSIEKCDRSHILSWTHHLLVAPLESDDQTHWLNLAQQNNWSVAELRKQLKRPHVSNNSGNNEWYTPSEYIEAARQAMGGIDCDPATSEFANKTIQAETYYTIETNGLENLWHGRVWMNPPYAQPHITDFCNALFVKYQSGEISEACVLVNNATDTRWFHTLFSAATCGCFTRGRIRFIDIEGKASGAPLQGQAILYFGPNVTKFAQAFSIFGKVVYFDAR